MIQRDLSPRLEQALSDTPVIFVQGARQVGKSTLVRLLTHPTRKSRYVTLDDPTARHLAAADPQAFIQAPDTTLIIDEVQRVPDLLLAIKQQVDNLRQPGAYILTGSANVLLMPRIADALVGRVEILTLWPFSQRELADHKPASTFIDDLFSKDFSPQPAIVASRQDVISTIVRGGYPEALTRTNPLRRSDWFASYISTLLDRDVRDLAQIEQLERLPRLLSLLADRNAQLLNTAALSRACAIPVATLHRYLTLLQTTFLLTEIRPWSADLSLRWVRSPKLYMADTGLACHLLGLSEQRLLDDPVMLGPLMENLVVMEIQKLRGVSQTRTSQFHFRVHTGQEVDVVLESPDGHCVGIEVKTSASVGSGDLAGLKLLQQKLGERFVRGIILYLGESAYSAGKDLFIVPASRLWS